jgi:polyketide biosynthesis enoyl-CoA hydratase PksI
MAVLTMTGKDQNCINKNSFAEFESIIDELQNRDEISLVILRAEGRYFSSGADKQSLIDIHHKKYCPSLAANILAKYMQLPQVLIGEVSGHAVGGGLCLALCNDLYFFNSASLYGFNYMKYGFTPGLGATFLAPYCFERQQANRLLLTGDLVKGRDLKLGDSIVDNAKVKDIVEELGLTLVDRGNTALRVLKKQLLKDKLEGFKQAIEQEKEMHAQTFHQNHILNQIEEF